MKKYLITFLIGFISLSFSQKREFNDAKLFDFWIGEWELKWDDGDGETGTGTNSIFRILKDNVIFENFSAETGKLKGFVGKSYSVFNQKTGEWKQTWVDNQGSYLDFNGKTDGENKIFEREFINPAGKKIMQRMVFKDIETNKFIWDWEVSADEGKTWTLRWQIFYERKDSK